MSLILFSFLFLKFFGFSTGFHRFYFLLIDFKSVNFSRSNREWVCSNMSPGLEKKLNGPLSPRKARVLKCMNLCIGT